MQKTFKKYSIAAAVALMGVVTVPGVMAKEDVICFADGSCKKGTWVTEDVFCFDGICTGRPKIWTPELGEVDASKYTEEELRKILDDYWTPERMHNAVGVMPTVPECTETDEHCIDDKPSYDKDEFWTPERIKNAKAVEVITEDGVGRRALLAEGLILDKKIIPPDATEEMIASRDFWTPERLRKALPIGTFPLGAVVRGVHDVPDISISIEKKGDDNGTAPDWIGGVSILPHPVQPAAGKAD